MKEKIIEIIKNNSPEEAANEILKLSFNLPVIGSLPSGDNEPYFGWCNVEGCEGKGCSGGNAWRETGYWTVCYKHSADYREGKPQPKMKQKYIDREKSRLPDGTLPVARQ